MPSLFLSRNNSQKLFAQQAPSVLYSKRDQELFMKNAMEYNNGTLVPINSDFLSGLLRRDTGIPSNMSLSKLGQTKETPRNFGRQIHPMTSRVIDPVEVLEEKR